MTLYLVQCYPPVVVGATIGKTDFHYFEGIDNNDTIEWLSNHTDDLSLIDGMQRTTAMVEASQVSDLSQYMLRVEVWLAHNINNLIYRMLVLNSGQVPWDIKRQLETVFSSVLRQIKDDLPGVTIYSQDETRRRVAAGQYQASNILELYLVFGSRKEKIDIKERLSDEFVRLDFMDLTSSDESIQQFSKAILLMSKLDHCFSRITEDDDQSRFACGRDVFSSQPACVGFVVATAILMLGRPGSSQNKELLVKRWAENQESIEGLLANMEQMHVNDQKAFLSLPTLSEKLSMKKSSKVGDFEREFFKAAFTTMYEEGPSLNSFEVCWNAY